MLFIKIIDLHNIAKQDFFIKNNFYVKIVYNNMFRVTTTKRNNDGPIWNESFVFDINSFVKTLDIIIMKKNSLNDTVFKKITVNVNYNKEQIYRTELVNFSMGDIHYDLKKQLKTLTYDFTNIKKIINDRDKQLITLAKNLSKCRQLQLNT